MIKDMAENCFVSNSDPRWKPSAIPGHPKIIMFFWPSRDFELGHGSGLGAMHLWHSDTFWTFCASVRSATAVYGRSQGRIVWVLRIREPITWIWETTQQISNKIARVNHAQNHKKQQNHHRVTFVYDEENNGTHGTSDFGMESKFAYRKWFFCAVQTLLLILKW